MMRMVQSIYLLTTLTCVWSSADPLKEALEEAKQFAQGARVAQEHFLQEVQKDEAASLQEAVGIEGQMAHTQDPRSLQKPFDLELNTLLQEAKKQAVETSDEILNFSEGQAYAFTGDQPKASIGIAEISTEYKEVESKLVTCQEGGSYQATVDLRLNVEHKPPVIEKTFVCQGHSEESRRYFSKDHCSKWVHARENELSDEKNIDSYWVGITRGGAFQDYQATANWKHTPGVVCIAALIKEKIVEPERIVERWVSPEPEKLAYLKDHHLCRLLYSAVVEGPNTRLVAGEPIYRETWAKQLFFSCEADKNSKCNLLRADGGIFVSKRCLYRNDLGECETWEKTYDVGKKGAKSTSNYTFSDEKVWGMNEIEAPEYEQNKDLGPSVGVLASLAGVDQDRGVGDKHPIEIFKGSPKQCTRSFIQGAVFDCCTSMKGIAVKAHLAGCNDEEKCLAESRDRGACHYVGTLKEKAGMVTRQVYCCYASKLARVVQEEAHEQLGLGWGSAGCPNCQGLGVGQIKRLDFAKLDLSEAIEDIESGFDKEAFLKKLQYSAQQLQGKRGEIEGDTRNLLKDQEVVIEEPKGDGG